MTGNEANNVDVTKSPTKSKSWHWHSNPETTSGLEVSVVALLETICAVGFYIWLAINGYTLHLITSACVAPFLLLRTNESTELALTKGLSIFEKLITPFEKFDEECDWLPEWIKFPLIWIIFAPTIAIVLFGIKLGTTIVSVIKSPIKSLLVIPENWWRMIGCIDIFHPPEPLPGYHTSKVKIDWSDFDFIVHPMDNLSETYEKMPINLEEWLIALIVAPLAFIFLAFPAFLYRWSLKGSSIIYLPLLWMVSVSVGGNTRSRMEDIKDLSFHKLRRWFGFLIFVFLASKLFLAKLWDNLNELWLSTDPYGFMTLFIAPLEIPRWQIASATNGLLAWMILFVVEAALQNANRNNLSIISEGYVVAARILWLLGSILTLYTLSVLLYNVGTLQWNFIPIGEDWFPW